MWILILLWPAKAYTLVVIHKLRIDLEQESSSWHYLGCVVVALVSQGLDEIREQLLVASKQCANQHHIQAKGTLGSMEITVAGTPADQQSRNLDIDSACRSVNLPTTGIGFENTKAELLFPINSQLHRENLILISENQANIVK